MVELAAAAKVINHVVDKIQQFTDRLAHSQPASLHKINNPGIQSIASRTPLVLL
jgi:hypothetical protein